MFSDTIAAIATAMSPAGIGIVRVSGDQAVELVDRVYRSKNKNKHLVDMESHTIHYGYIVDGEETIDEVMVLIMKAPNSYTKEDTVEIDCHGGVLVMKRILETLVKYGARLAEPGEFTKRAFLNGRIDLSSAEAVIDLINSKNEFARKSSLDQVQGSVFNKIESLREEILEQTAFIEAALDDPEHYSLDGYSRTLRNKVDQVQNQLNTLIHSYKNGSILHEGINTVIVGKPNAGKSSLLNILAGKEKAIVTDIAGTTRDIIEEQIQLGGISLNMIDTAGIRETDDIIEKLGVDKAKEIIEEADLILYVVDSSKELDKNDYEIIELLQGKKAIVLLNKTDLNVLVTEEFIKEKIDSKVISISAKENLGITDLEKEIETMFLEGQVSFNDEIYITNARQAAALEETQASLNLVIQGIDNEMPEDFLSIDLMNAYEALGSITGQTVGEDLINEIFGKFCMGK